MLPLHETQLEPGSATRHVPSPYKSYGIGLSPRYLPAVSSHTLPTEAEKANFIKTNRVWIVDYALFCALRDHFKTDDWRKWNRDLKRREKKALDEWSEKLKKNIDHYVVLQWKLDQSYTQLKKKAQELDISLVGDLPFYLSVQSPLVWAHQEVFQLDENGAMEFVSGVPNSPKAHFGRQVWGHPLYKWDSENHRQTIIRFWKMRFRYLAKLFDFIRFDHAKGLFEYAAIDPLGGKEDTYRKGPGSTVFEELVRHSHHYNLRIFAEDSGEKLQELRKSLRKLKIPGIKIFRFAFDQKRNKVNTEYADISGYSSSTVAYTTTHDTETLLGYLALLNSDEKQNLARFSYVKYHIDDLEFAKEIRNAIIESSAQMVIIPLQDWLLTTERINVPGTELPINDPNWQYRMKTAIEDIPDSFK